MGENNKIFELKDEQLAPKVIRPSGRKKPVVPAVEKDLAELEQELKPVVIEPEESGALNRKQRIKVETDVRRLELETFVEEAKRLKQAREQGVAEPLPIAAVSETDAAAEETAVPEPPEQKALKQFKALAALTEHASYKERSYGIERIKKNFVDLLLFFVSPRAFFRRRREAKERRDIKVSDTSRYSKRQELEIMVMQAELKKKQAEEEACREAERSSNTKDTVNIEAEGKGH